MKFDWTQYLNVAEEFIEHSQSSTFREAYLRSAISRSYYCAFCLARNFLKERGTVFPEDKINIHEFVIKTYSESGDRTEEKVGEDLKRLRNDRVNADYFEIMHVTEVIAKLDCGLARNTVDKIEEMKRKEKKEGE